MRDNKLAKRIAVLLLVCVMVVGLLSGCGTKQVSSKTTSDQTIEIRISDCNSDSHPQTLGLYAMKEYIEKESDGKIKISVFPNSQLGDEEVSLQQVQSGTLEMATASFGPLATFQKKFFVMDIPFLFNNYEEAWMVLDSSVGTDLLDSLEESGLKGMAYMENGFRHITTKNRPISSLPDLKGLKIRTMNAPMHIKNFQALGANPTPVPFSELYMAMSQNIVVGQENPLANIWDLNMFEVQNNVALTGHIYDAMPLVANLDWWNRLPAEYQTIIQKGAIIGQNYSRFCNYEREKLLEEKLIEKGMKIVHITDQAKEEMRAVSQKIVIDAVKEKTGEEAVTAFMKGIEEAKQDVTKGIK